MEFNKIKELLLDGNDKKARNLLTKYDTLLSIKNIKNILNYSICDTDSPLTTDYIFNNSSHSWKIDIDKYIHSYKYIRIITGKGHIDIIKLFLTYNISDYVYYDYALSTACTFNKLEIIKLLLPNPKINPSSFENESIIYASVYGDANTVKLLLKDPRIDPSIHGNQSLLEAGVYGHTEVVKLLLEDERVDPSQGNNEIIKRVCWGNWKQNADVVRLLLRDTRVLNMLPDEVKQYATMINDKEYYSTLSKQQLDVIIHKFNY
jgi:ankyrin repeat protein